MLKNVQEELNRFAKYVISQSRANLTRGKKNASKELWESLDSEIKVSKNSFQLSFLMEDYGVFQDKGVSGTEKKYNTPFKYTNKKPPASAFSQWVIRKGLKGTRDKKGKFVSRKSLQFAIANTVFRKGIKPSLFFTKPFEKAFKNLDKDLIEAYKLDVEQLIKTTVNNK
tara:strand:+ start:252 stop:758 length:507 start_codon:yes stop_codon:yes gene_type:complete